MPSGRFAANGAWLAVQVMAHNLARWTARIGLGERTVTTKTLRRRVFALVGRITRSARRLPSVLMEGEIPDAVVSGIQGLGWGLLVATKWYLSLYERRLVDGSECRRWSPPGCDRLACGSPQPLYSGGAHRAPRIYLYIVNLNS